MRSRFHGSHDLVHRLFVCISGAPSGPGWARAWGYTGSGPRWKAWGTRGGQAAGSGWHAAGVSQDIRVRALPGVPHHVTLPRAREEPPAKRWALCGLQVLLVWGWSPGLALPRPWPPTREVLFNLDVLIDAVSFCP